jgi:hypothetical protein
MSEDKSHLPSNGVLVMNRRGLEVLRQGLDPPPAYRQDTGIQDVLDLERLKSLILQHPAALAGHTSVRLYTKHSEGCADCLVDYNEVWDPERPDDSQSDSEEHPPQGPDDDVGYTQEISLLVGIISDEMDHSNEVYSEYGCPLQRRLCIIYLPAGIAWADLKGLVTGLSMGIGMEEIWDAMKEIDYVRGVMGEWSDPLEVEWIDGTGEKGENVKVCRILVERRKYDPEVWEPWSDAFDDGASNLRRIEIVYHSSTPEEESGQEVVVGLHQNGKS